MFGLRNLMIYVISRSVWDVLRHLVNSGELFQARENVPPPRENAPRKRPVPWARPVDYFASHYLLKRFYDQLYNNFIIFSHI